MRTRGRRVISTLFTIIRRRMIVLSTSFFHTLFISSIKEGRRLKMAKEGGEKGGGSIGVIQGG